MGPSDPTKTHRAHEPSEKEHVNTQCIQQMGHSKNLFLAEQAQHKAQHQKLQAISHMPWKAPKEFSVSFSFLYWIKDNLGAAKRQDPWAQCQAGRSPFSRSSKLKYFLLWRWTFDNQSHSSLISGGENSSPFYLLIITIEWDDVICRSVWNSNLASHGHAILQTHTSLIATD